MADYHSLERTSPKGEGHDFVGRCTKCGKTDLKSPFEDLPCTNPAGRTQDDDLIDAIEGPQP